MGQCMYTLLQTDDYTIDAENVACAGGIFKEDLPAASTAALPSCTKSIRVKIPGEQTIKLHQNKKVTVNGIEVTHFPYEINMATIKITSSLFLVVEFIDGLEIWWDGAFTVHIDASSSYKGQTRGLCGTFTSNQDDDFLTPEGDTETDVALFANKWKTDEKCEDVPNILQSHPCEINIQNKEMAEKHCGKLKSELFAKCHWYVNPDSYYADCLYDMCSCKAEIPKCLCTIFAAYGDTCAAMSSDARVSWRDSVRECGIACPGNQIYQLCGDSCTRSCEDIALNPKCKPKCVEGCNCPQGHTLDKHGECVAIATCACQQEGQG